MVRDHTFLFKIVLFAAPLFLMACTSGPPKILSLQSGIEETYNPRSNLAEKWPILVIQAEDPDGVQDFSYVEIQVPGTSIYWRIGKEALSPSVQDSTGTIIVRNIQQTPGLFPAQTKVTLVDRAGNSDSGFVKIENADGLVGPFPIKNLSMTRENQGFTLRGSGSMVISQLEADGRVIITKNLEPGTHSWQDWGQGPNPSQSFYIQKALGGLTPYFMTSGPW